MRVSKERARPFEESCLLVWEWEVSRLSEKISGESIKELSKFSQISNMTY